MKQFGKILKFELKNYMKNKVFVGVTVLLVVIIAVVMFMPRILNQSGDESDDKSIENPTEVMLLAGDNKKKKYDDVDEQTLWWINKALSYSGYPSHVGKQKIKEHIKEIETMENNKVRQFIDLLVNEEETIENAAKVSGIGDMKLVDVLKTISEMEFESIKAFSSAVAGMNSMKEAIHTVKDLDDALVELKKSSEK